MATLLIAIETGCGLLAALLVWLHLRRRIHRLEERAEVYETVFTLMAQRPDPPPPGDGGKDGRKRHLRVVSVLLPLLAAAAGWLRKSWSRHPTRYAVVAAVTSGVLVASLVLHEPAVPPSAAPPPAPTSGAPSAPATTLSPSPHRRRWPPVSTRARTMQPATPLIPTPTDPPDTQTSAPGMPMPTTTRDMPSSTMPSTVTPTMTTSPPPVGVPIAVPICLLLGHVVILDVPGCLATVGNLLSD
ncbi:MAG TPA: hypothetical protein VFX16_23745 [Pseudonocardiaceae bacterium]|nr:hypothetical protein [Pseudonocardiaceae bacterium]